MKVIGIFWGRHTVSICVFENMQYGNVTVGIIGKDKQRQSEGTSMGTQG